MMDDKYADPDCNKSNINLPIHLSVWFLLISKSLGELEIDTCLNWKREVGE